MEKALYTYGCYLESNVYLCPVKGIIHSIWELGDIFLLLSD